MSLIGNLLWLICGGLLTGLGYILGGLLLCLTVIGIPFGLQAIRLGTATLAPFGKSLVSEPDASRPTIVILNILWAVIVGWGIAVAHLVSAAALAVTIIGIPFALQHVKLIPMALMPFGHHLE